MTSMGRSGTHGYLAVAAGTERVIDADNVNPLDRKRKHDA